MRPARRTAPILAEIEHAPLLGAADYMLNQPRSRFAHEIAGLMRQLESRDKGAAVIAFTAAEAGEAKSAIALSLVRAVAAAGRKAVLIDGDGAAGIAARAMGASADAGLFEVLSGSTTLGDALALDPRSDAWLLASVTRAPSDAPEKYEAKRFSARRTRQEK